MNTMTFISDILNKKTPSYGDLILCFEHVRANGDIAVIKFDGERQSNQYTVFITFPIIKKREMIRVDGSNLENALISCLQQYISKV
jgi:hypothetical protein